MQVKKKSNTKIIRITEKGEEHFKNSMNELQKAINKSARRLLKYMEF